MGSTLSALVDRVQNNYGETSTAFTEEPEIKQWIQEAHNDLAETGYLVAEATISLVDGQENYDISGTTATNEYKIHTLLDVSILHDGGTQWYRIKPRHFERIKHSYDGTEKTDGTFSNESTPAWYAWVGPYLYLDPPPSYDETNGLKLMFYAIETIDDDTDTTHLPWIGEEAVVDYCIAMWAAKDNNVPKHQYYLQRYDEKKSKMRGWLKTNRSNVPQMALPGHMRRVQM